MTRRNYEITTPTEAQALRAFTVTKTEAIAGDTDAAFALAIYAALAQIIVRLDKIAEAVK